MKDQISDSLLFTAIVVMDGLLLGFTTLAVIRTIQVYQILGYFPMLFLPNPMLLITVLICSFLGALIGLYLIDSRQPEVFAMPFGARIAMESFGAIGITSFIGCLLVAYDIVIHCITLAR